MKAFLSTVKGKVIAGVSTVGVIGAVVAAVVILNSGYRTIVVNEMNGTTQIKNSSGTSDAYVSQHLKSGDDVTVQKESDLTLALDLDKIVYAEESTHFWIEATGKRNDTRTKIYMDAGACLNRIDNKLNESEEYKVDTPNATMSVRGTVFRVSCSVDKDGIKYTLVEVFEGEVQADVKMENGTYTGASRIIKAGESAKIRSGSDFSEFVDDEEDGQDPNTIRYANLPKKTAMVIGKAIDDGRNICIGKDLLYDYVQINDHKFEKQVVEASCTEAGYEVDKCAVCGLEQNKKAKGAALGHDFQNTNGESVCSRCGLKDEQVSEKEDEEEEDENVEEKTSDEEDEDDGELDTSKKKKTVKDEASVTPAPNPTPAPAPAPATDDTKTCENGHTYKTTTTAATCTKAGKKVQVCSVCGDTKTTTIAKKGHSYTDSTTAATCLAAGKKVKTCSRCGTSTTTTIAALGHNVTNWTMLDTSHAGTCTRCAIYIQEEHVNTYTYRALPTGGSEHDATCKVCGVTATTPCVFEWTPGNATTQDSHTLKCICGATMDEQHSGTQGEACEVCGETIPII